jgi:hypothetical protein
MTQTLSITLVDNFTINIVKFQLIANRFGPEALLYACWCWTGASLGHHALQAHPGGLFERELAVGFDAVVHGCR